MEELRWLYFLKGNSYLESAYCGKDMLERGDIHDAAHSRVHLRNKMARHNDGD